MNSDVVLREDIDDLTFVVEQERFVLSNNNWFCVALNCDNCPYTEFCETEMDELEINLIPATRRSVGTATITEGTFTHSVNIDEITSNTKVNNRWENEDGYLSRKDVKIYKKMISLETAYEDNEIPYILFDEGLENYYCVKQVCDDCPFQDSCEVELEERPNVMKIVATDVRSQEPRGFTLLSREPNWISVFVNDSLREIEGLLTYIDLIFKEEFKIDVTTSQHYFAYLDNRFFFDKTILYQFNYLCEAYRKGLKVNKALLKMIEAFNKDYQSFLTDIEEGRVKLKHIPQLSI